MKIIQRVCNETNEVSLISLEEAKQKLSGYWVVEKIEPMLEKGDVLHTPYATYQQKKISELKN